MAVETGLVLPVVGLLLVAVLGATSVVADQLAVVRAARAAARTLAVTGDRVAATTAASTVTPGAQVRVTVRGGVAHVAVRLDGQLLGVGYGVTADAAAPLEPVAR